MSKKIIINLKLSLKRYTELLIIINSQSPNLAVDPHPRRVRVTLLYDSSKLTKHMCSLQVPHSMK